MNKTDNKRSKTTFVRVHRHSSDVDFSQLYDSCPHLINAKASHMNTSCTTIDTVVYPTSPCSSFRSFANSNVNLNTNCTTEKIHKTIKSSTTSTVTLDMTQSENKITNTLSEPADEPTSSCPDTCTANSSVTLETNSNQTQLVPSPLGTTEDCTATDEITTPISETTNNTLPTCSENNQAVDFTQHRQLNRPFSYIKNTDQSSIFYHFAQPQPKHQQIYFTSDKLKSSHNDQQCNQVKLKTKNFEETTNNIYETVGESTILKRHHHPLCLSGQQQPQPIYETDWTQNLRQLMRTMKHPQQHRTNVSIIELPYEHYTHMMNQSNLYDMRPSSSHYSVHKPYNFLANHTSSESLRRTNILKRLRDDSAFLY
ncbi:unnamed protein product [Didymodactylos carnosus]|uniref:Uncharacterized protein n=1 Tax=Didymodactylos carnosus TaxID=1234261 RepID=A0A8S2D8Y1_9BILA|nr:unnamed protein product [Didymodactylos carnosus]CAF3626574.1 unnamed protein product [Didymodactylos carnosus]